MGKCATKKTRGYALGGSLMGQQDPQDPLGLLPTTTAAPKPSPLLQQMDQKIAMSAAMGNLSNTERYQLANPGNQPYKAGSVAPGSSAEASQLNQQNSILQSLRNNIAGQKIASFSEGGAVKETPEQLMARMAAKYGAPAAGPQEQPAPQPAAPPPAAAEPKAKSPVGLLGLLGSRKDQIDKAVNGYANGGKIKGPGTATSDSIPAEVEETGEPIAVSNKERIVSEAQDNLLQLIAKGVGFKTLDAMLEAGTGKPVGPTVKGGKLAARNGMARDYSIPLNEQIKGEQAIANKVEYVPPAPAPVKRNEILTDASARAADPEFAATAGPMIRPISVGATGNAGRGMANPPPVRPLTGDAPLSGGEIPPAQAAQREQIGMGDQRFVADAVQPTMKSGAYTIGSTSGSIAGKSPVDATQMSAPDGGGYVTNKQGKAMYLPPQATAPRDPSRAYDSHGNDMTYTNEMKSQLADMERERYARDMQADIKDPRVIAIGKLNTDRMNTEQTLGNQTQQAQQQSISAGLNNQVTRNQLAQSAVEQQMIGRLNDQNLTAEQRSSLRSDLLVTKGKNPNEHRYIPLDETTYNDMGQPASKTGFAIDTITGNRLGGGQSPNASQTPPSFASKGDLQAAIKAGKVKPGQVVNTPNGPITVK